MTPFLLGGAGVAVVVVLLFAMSRGGSGDADKTASPGAAAKTNSPAAAPASAPATPPAAAPASAPRAGKTPTKPAPLLTAETLQQAQALLQQAKGLCNEGITARAAGKNEEARGKQSAAKDKIEAIEQMTAKQWDWLSEAELEGWALSAEYATMAKLYDDLLNLKNKVRKGGGT